MLLGQEEEFVWHHVIRIGDGNGLRTPVYCDTRSFINPVGIMVFGWSLESVVWEKREQAVGICVQFVNWIVCPLDLNP